MLVQIDKKEIIAVDQDFVLAKLTEKWIKYYNVIFEDDLKLEDIKSWNIVEYVKPEAKEYILNFLNLHKFYRDLEVVKDSQRVLKKLLKNYEIIIVTDPFTRMSFKSKYDWLGEHFPFIPSQNYVFTGNKSIIRADYLIDDGVHNLESFSGYGILYESPYSENENRFYKVKNWQDIEHLFEYRLDELKKFYNDKKGRTKCQEKDLKKLC